MAVWINVVPLSTNILIIYNKKCQAQKNKKYTSGIIKAERTQSQSSNLSIILPTDDELG